MNLTCFLFHNFLTIFLRLSNTFLQRAISVTPDPIRINRRRAHHRNDLQLQRLHKVHIVLRQLSLVRPLIILLSTVRTSGGVTLVTVRAPHLTPVSSHNPTSLLGVPRRRDRWPLLGASPAACLPEATPSSVTIPLAPIATHRLPGVPLHRMGFVVEQERPRQFRPADGERDPQFVGLEPFYAPLHDLVIVVRAGCERFFDVDFWSVEVDNTDRYDEGHWNEGSKVWVDFCAEGVCV